MNGVRPLLICAGETIAEAKREAENVLDLVTVPTAIYLTHIKL